MANNDNELNLITMSELRSNFTWEFMSEFYCYYKQSTTNEMRDDMVELCVNHYFDLSPSCCFLEVAEPDFWILVLERMLTVDGGNMEVLSHWSTLVLPIFEKIYSNIEAVDKIVFQTFTGSRYLPVINNIDDVWILLAMEVEVVGVDKKKLSSLQLRGIDCLCKYWRECDYDKLIHVEMEGGDGSVAVVPIVNGNDDSAAIVDDEEGNMVFPAISDNDDDNMLIGINKILKRESKKFLRVLYLKAVSYQISS